MILACLAWTAWADPAADVVRQRQVVDAAAAAAAEARLDGARRSEVAERMRVYREAAATLEALEATVGPPAEEVRRERLAAVAALNRALAEGDEKSESREVLRAWLGDAPARMALLSEAVDAGLAAPAEIRSGVLLDVVEQADALAVGLAFDAWVLESEADRLELRALSLRRRGPGQAASMSDEVEALRLEAAASEANEGEEAAMALRGQVLELRARAAAALMEDG